MKNAAFLKTSLYQALRVAAIYVVIASLWIIFSDRLLDYFVDDHNLYLVMQTVKGWFFVLVTGIFLFAERKINHERFFRSKNKYDTFIDQSAEGMVMTDRDGCIVVWNSAMVQMTGLTAPEVRGRGISDISSSIWDIEQHGISRPVLEEMLRSGSPALIDCDDVTINRGDEKRCFELMLFVISAGDGYSLGAVIHDVTERRKTEEQLVASVNEKNVLLKEIHHRVKNNLQVIISLLRMQEKAISDGKELAAFRDSQSRIRAIAMIHEGLYQSGDLSRIFFSDYLRRLVADLPIYFNMKKDSVHFTINCDDIRFSIDKAFPWLFSSLKSLRMLCGALQGRMRRGSWLSLYGGRIMKSSLRLQILWRR